MYIEGFCIFLVTVKNLFRATLLPRIGENSPQRNFKPYYNLELANFDTCERFPHPSPYVLRWWWKKYIQPKKKWNTYDLAENVWMKDSNQKRLQEVPEKSNPSFTRMNHYKYLVFWSSAVSSEWKMNRYEPVIPQNEIPIAEINPLNASHFITLLPARRAASASALANTRNFYIRRETR